MGIIFLKSLLSLLEYCFCFFFFGPEATRDRICMPCIGGQSLHHWSAREVSKNYFYFVGNVQKSRKIRM